MSSPSSWNIKQLFWERTITNSAGPPPSSSQNTMVVESTIDYGTRVKSLTSDYKYRIAHKLALPFNSYSFSRTMEFKPVIEYWNTVSAFGGDSTNKSGYMLSDAFMTTKYFPFVFSDQTRLENMVTRKLLSRLKDQDVNLGVAYAEHKKLAESFLSAVPRIAKAYLALKRGQLDQAVKQLLPNADKYHDVTVYFSKTGKRLKRPYTRRVGAAQAHSQWLELQYAWKPLINDIYGAAVAVAKANLHVSRNKVSASITQKQGDVVVVNVMGQKKVIKTEIMTRNYIVTSQAVAYFSSDSIASAASLGLTNPAEIAWELMPYSFVIDWFLPIGNYLSTLDADYGHTFLGGSRTYYLWRKFDGIVNLEPDIAYNGKQFGVNGAFKGSGVTLQISRQPLTSFPRPPLPSFKNPFSLLHITNALALLRNLKTQR